jgi:hypothetical protein
MKYLKTYESRENVIDRKVYWIAPTDERLEDALVQLYKQYTDWETPIQPVSDALGLADNIRKILRPKGPLMIITLRFSIDEIKDKVVKGPSFQGWDFEDRQELEEEKYIPVGKINVEDYEIDAIKYNL